MAAKLLLLNWVARVVSSVRFLGNFIGFLPRRPSLVFVLNGMNFQRFSLGVPVPEKVELVEKILLEQGVTTLFCIHPFGILPKGLVRTNYISFEFLSLLIPGLFTFYPKSFGVRSHNLTWKGSFFPQWQKNLWAIFLIIVRPKALIGMGLDEDLVSICRKLNIKTIEIQHGSVSDIFPYPPQRFSRPDYFMAWTAIDAKVIELSGVSAIVSGFPFDFTSVTPIKEKSQSLTTLITLSYNESPSIDPFGLINESLREYLDFARARNHLIIFRIHPTWRYGLGLGEKKICEYSQVKEYFTAVFPNSILRDPLDFPLYEDLASSNLHVTHGSSAVLEASLLGIPSIITNKIMGSREYSGLLNQNNVYYQNDNSISEILTAILVSEPKLVKNSFDSSKWISILKVILQ